MIDRNLAKTREIAEEVRKLGGRTFFAGGFVRDRLLGLESKDVDIEVHGIEADKLSELLRSMGNVRTQGKSFGIYSLGGYDIDIALPRKERNTGRGHRDFEVFTDPHLGTEAAARRRDFTMNSMMEDVLTGEVVDHFRGIEDLEKGIIRHIDSESFREDPLRVLRGARFAARFGFTVAPETVKLCRGMELSALPAERIMTELEKGLCKSRKPSIFFRVLRDMDQLKTWFPEIEKLIGLRQDPVYHPEGDVWEHTMEVLDRAVCYRDRALNPLGFMLTALTHDLGKIETTEEINGRIHAYGHELAGRPIVASFLRRITRNRELTGYVINMTTLHMKPNIVAGSRGKIKSTNRMFDESVSPEDLIAFSRIDRFYEAYDGEEEDALKFLNERLEIYREYMARPHVTGGDLIDAGITPDECFGRALEYAHKLRLAGVDKSSALKQTIAFNRQLTKQSSEIEK